ncbi:hypothetical protein [Arthrobacter cavernae]|uniref:Uncharacterized protein n=1 Tax=Arthrobacter cavernae TaxID=2817681 RepID=A0A939HK08_9MICC|nr:hypothetical protein [Arthrobacter cavernae]MBO1269598.1 hypothetical protein [Arthrobacter cavernae]
MSTIAPAPAPAPARNPYATEANPQLQRHHWQNLGCLVASFRPEWPIDDILTKLFDARHKQTFPELAHIALAVAMNPQYKGPGAIYLMAAGVIEQ